MIFSIEALYALHMITNDGYSEDLFLLPLFLKLKGKRN